MNDINRNRYLPAGLAATTLVAGAWAVRDYGQWRRLGDGGLPHNAGGWLRMTAMRLRARSRFDGTNHNQEEEISPILLDLQARGGTRPKAAPHPVPNRVVDQHAPAPVKQALVSVFDDFSRSDSPPLEYRTSRWEKHHNALCLKGDAYPHAISRGASGELGHVHPSDGSMHMILSPGDARLVLDLGWGEFHPLAGMMLELPATYTLIYPPRSLAEIAPIRAILSAAVGYMTGQPAPPTPTRGSSA
ncbi:hypothetical protein [Streptomyces iranensis]|uniref:luciferase domain-containing protein n=1 Tax=Streptomyces iranensis TaxID=576784 RepID=UPI0039B77659